MATTLDTYAPYDSGAGSSVTEDTWRKFMRHMLGSASGIIRGFQNEFNPSAAGTGMTVTVDTGECWIRGQYGENASLKTLSIAAAHATLARKDRIILRNDFTNNRIELDVLTGTAAASPSAPNLTQTTSLWETSVGIVDVPATDTVITSNQVTDDRMYTSAQARYTKSADQSTTDSVFTKTTYNTVISRSGDISFDSTNNQFTLLRSGLWIIQAQTRFAPNATGKREIIIADPSTVSGATCSNILGQQGATPGGSVEQPLSCGTTMRFAANQIVAAFTYQNSGGSLNILAASNSTAISIAWFGP